MEMAIDDHQVALSLLMCIQPNRRADTSSATHVFHRSSIRRKMTPRQMISSPTATARKSMSILNCSAPENPFQEMTAQPDATIVLTTNTMKRNPTSRPNRECGMALRSGRLVGHRCSRSLTNKAYMPRTMAAHTIVSPG